LRGSELRPPPSIHLYDGGRCDSLDLKEVLRYLRARLTRAEVDIREDILSRYLSRLPPQEREREVLVLARQIAGARVHRPDKRGAPSEPLAGEIEYERRNLFSDSFGVLYDGLSLLHIFVRFIPQTELEHCHIALVNQLFGTWDQNDLRFHIRVSLYGFPTLISTTGMVEAPAKPREFYLRRQLGEDPISLKREFEARFIDYDDPRMTEVMKGYAMQAVFFHLTGNPFCEEKSCRLYNAHWQEEVLGSQLYGQDLCPRHQAVLAALAGEAS